MSQQNYGEYEDQIDTPKELRVDTTIVRSKAPLLIGGGFALLFGNIFMRGRAQGKGGFQMFGEARVKAQIAAVATLCGFGLYMGLTQPIKQKNKLPS